MQNLKKSIKRVLKITAVVLVIGAVVYQVKFAPVTVQSHRVERGELVVEVMGTGTLEARVEATISPKISGRVVKLFVDQGDQVAADDLLVRLDDEELKQQVAIATANVEAAAAAIQRLNTDKASAVAVYDQARSSNARVQALVSRDAASRDDADKAAEALAVAQSGIARAEAAIAESQKQLVAAQKTEQYHRTRLRDTEIRAPFAGLIVNRTRESGDVVVPGSSILTLISTSELWISAWVDETEMSRLETDQPARVVFRSESDRSYPGSVARLGRQADRETREFIVDVRVLDLPKNWAVGQRAEAFIQVAKQCDAVVLPAIWITNRDDQTGVFVNVEGVARWRPLKLGSRNRDSVEVLDGLSDGEVVVLAVGSVKELQDGRRIR